MREEEGARRVRIHPSRRRRRRTTRVEAGSTPPVAVASGPSLPSEPTPTATITHARRRRRRSVSPSPPSATTHGTLLRCLPPRQRHPSPGEQRPPLVSVALSWRAIPSQRHHPLLWHSGGNLFTAAPRQQHPPCGSG